MTATAILLVIVSAVLHVGWNFFGKRGSPSVSFFLVANLIGALIFAPLLLTAGGDFWRDVAGVLPWILLTGVCQGTYLAFLAMAYRVGDLSLVYPFTRSVAPVFVYLIIVLTGHTSVGIHAIAGILLVVLGSLLLPLRHLTDLHWRSYFTQACGFGLVAALGTTGYMIIDSHCLSVLRENTNDTMAALYYAPLEAASTTLILGAFTLSSRAKRKEFLEVLRAFDRRLILMGLAIQTGYALILLAMSFVSDVTYVAGFRQLSVPFGAAAGMIWLREPAYRTKVLGVVICFLGLILIALPSADA